MVAGHLGDGPAEAERGDNRLDLVGRRVPQVERDGPRRLGRRDRREQVDQQGPGGERGTGGDFRVVHRPLEILTNAR